MTNIAWGYPGSIILVSTPGRANNSCPTYYANCKSVPFTLDEAIFEVASEAILNQMYRSKGIVDWIA